MKHINKLYSTLIGLFVVINGVTAQEVPTRLTLQQSLQYALKYKADVLKSDLDVEKSLYQIQEAKSEMLPGLSVDGNLLNNSILQESALPGELFGEAPGSVIMAPLGQKWNADVGISLTQKIFDQSIFIGLKAAKTTREFYELNKKLTDDAIIEKVTSQYYNVLILQARLQRADTSYQNTLKIQKIIQQQFENGLAKGVDVNRIKVKVFNLHAERQELTNTIQINKNTLKFLIGLPMDKSITLADKPLDLLINETDDFSVTDLTLYKSLGKQKEILNYKKQQLKVAGYPSLGLKAQYHYQGLGDQFPIGAGTEQQVYWTDYASINLNLHIPVFSGFKNKAKVRQANIDIEKIEIEMSDQELALHTAYENAKNQIRNSEITIENQEQNVVLAKQVAQDIQNNYAHGLSPLTDVLDAETALTEAQNNYNKALLDYRLAQLEYLKARGQLQVLLK